MAQLTTEYVARTRGKDTGTGQGKRSSEQFCRKIQTGNLSPRSRLRRALPSSKVIPCLCQIYVSMK